MLAREERLVRAPGEGLQLHFGKQQSAWGDRGEDTAQAGARQDGSGELWEPCGGAQRPFGFSLRSRKGLWPPYRRGRPKAGPEGSAAARDSRARGAGSGFARVSPPRRRRHRAATGGQVKSIRAADFIQDTEILGTGRFLEHNHLICKTSKIHQK